MSLAYVMCKHRIEEYKKCRQINDDSDGHDDALVQCQMRMPPLGKYSPRIAPADAMVIDFWPKRSSCGVVKLLSEASVQKAQNELST